MSDARAWDAQVTGYIYALQQRDGVDLLAYHWHPASISRVTRPHLHLGHIRHELVTPRTHVPTGRVRLSDIARLVIEEFGALPRRRDWVAVLEAARLAETR